jgi:uncharacterized sulfatase
MVKPGTRITQLVQNIDLAPTFIKATGLTPPDTVHGIALQPILSNPSSQSWRKDILYQYFDGGTPENTGPYNMPRHEGIRDTRYKLISFYDYKTWEFYDLKKDPRELNNLFHQESMKLEVKRLQKRLRFKKEELGL